MAVFEILEDIIAERGLSIADVARICNLPDSTVRGIIRRKQETIALEVAFKLSEGLEVSLEKLNGMPEKDLLSDMKNSPSTAEAAPGEDVLQIFDYLNEGLVNLGLIRDGEDITAKQAQILLGICSILRAAFDDQQ